MKPADALVQLNKALTDHKLSDWSGALDNAKRRFGVCRMSKKQISISRHLCELNSDAEVTDTILHEIAHALAWERHGVNCSHDKRWQAICIEIGARPVACFDNEVVQPEAPWVLVNRETGEVYRSYYKRPTRNWKDVWIRGRKTETHGKLMIRANVPEPATGDLFDSAIEENSVQKSSTTEKNAQTTTKIIDQFTSQSVADFKARLLSEIESLSKEHGIEITGSKGRFNEHECDLTLRFTLSSAPNREQRQQHDFERLANQFGLTSSHYFFPFNVNGQQFRLSGFKPNNRKYPIIGVDERGQKYKFELSILEQIKDQRVKD